MCTIHPYVILEQIIQDDTLSLEIWYPFRAYMFFFFSSRRRHTRFDCDWSSDVCSSDLFPVQRRQPCQPGRVRVIALQRFFQLRDFYRQVILAVGRHETTVLDGVAEQDRSEEHTSELQSQSNLVCRLLLEKKKNTTHIRISATDITPYPTTPAANKADTCPPQSFMHCSCRWLISSAISSVRCESRR